MAGQLAAAVRLGIPATLGVGMQVKAGDVGLDEGMQNRRILRLNLKPGIKNIGDRKNQIPIFAPYNISVFDTEFFKTRLICINSKAAFGVFLNGGGKINRFHAVITEKNKNFIATQISCGYNFDIRLFIFLHFSVTL
jgi:hypothetical protein